ncbi:MAG: type II toxin-antitoxin system HicB family antitoxin [Desulfamplus sp.]|nr:type II toxin-antitoxin system HicB family antitoxin [Desulfamplus sp.]
MKYPVLIHKEIDTDFGATIPDIPGCFTSGKTIQEVLENIQEAVSCYYEGEDITFPPVPSNIEDLMKQNDLYVEGGFWMLADIDFSFLSKKEIQIEISIPEYKLAIIDKAAEKRGMSRSDFLIQTVENVI